MTMKSFVFSLVLAVACLVVANVQADVISLTEAQKEYPTLYSMHVSGTPGNALKFENGEEFADYDLDIDYRSESYKMADLDPNLSMTEKLAETVKELTKVSLSYRVNKLGLITAPVYDYISWTKGTEAPILGLSINGELISDGNIWDVYDNADILYFGRSPVDGEFLVEFYTAKLGTTEEFDYNFDIAFFGPEVMDGPGDNTSPEPATLAVLGLGLAGLGAVTRRRRK